LSHPAPPGEICDSRNITLAGNTVLDAKVGLKLDPSCEMATIWN